VNPIGFRAEMVGNATALPANTPLTILTQPPTNVAVRATGSATLRVVARGSAPVKYQWYKGSEAISGATNAEFRFTNAAAQNAGAYSVRLTNSVNSVTSTLVNVTVQPELEVAPGRFARVTLEGSTGRPHRIDVAADLSAAGTQNWQPLTNLTLAPNPRTVVDDNPAAGAHRFYRAVRLEQ
jgi:hypothetical protein